MHHRVQIVLAMALLVLGSLTATRASAGSARTHDGFFLRLSAGGGAAKTELDVPGEKTEVSGESGDVNIAIGGVVTPNLALHGTLFGWLVSDPDVEIEGLGSGEIRNTDMDLSAYGVGLTYYFVPVNIYLSGSAGAGKISLDGPVDSESDTGFVGEVSLGKEWWVGANWGLGIAAALGLHSIPDGGYDESWKGASFALRFSATLN
jgi:hypothetical protein